LNKAKTSVKETASNVGNKIKSLDLKEKFKNTGEKTMKFAKETGTFVVIKGKEAYVDIIYY